MRIIFTVLLLGVLCADAQAALPNDVQRKLKQAGIPQDAVAVVVQEISTQKSLLRMNAERSMNPASTMKLLTTYAALDQLGPAYTWKTEAYLDGELKNGILQGDLILKGYGDPKLTVEQFWLWLAELRARGLRDIRGDLVLDRSYFELPPYDAAAFDNDPVRAYNVGPDALLLNFNTLRLRYLPDGDKLNVVAEPPLEGIRLDNHLLPQSGVGCDEWDDGIRVQSGGDSVLFEGGYPSECGEREHSLSVMPHTRYVDAVFRALWKNLGGTLQGTMREHSIGENAKLFSTHRSEPLSLTIRDINKFSNNVMARQLFLTLGASDHASIERSVQNVRTWLAKQSLDFPELVLENGAGLSRQERISAAHMAQLLQHAAAHPLSAELQASLPILGVDGSVKKRLKESPAASHAHLKTGTLSGVKTLAGYVRAQSGKEWIVVFFINHANAQRGQLAQDALIEWVQQKH